MSEIVVKDTECFVIIDNFNLILDVNIGKHMQITFEIKDLKFRNISGRKAWIFVITFCAEDKIIFFNVL